MSGTHFLTNCPRCGYIADARSLDGLNVLVCCKMCGYEGKVPHPDVKDGVGRTG